MKRYNGMGGDNTSGKKFKLLKPEQWVIAKTDSRNYLDHQKCDFVGYIISTGEWNSDVHFVKCFHKGSGKEDKLINLRTRQPAPEGIEVVMSNSDLEPYEMDAEIEKEAHNLVIHQMQLDALEKDDKEEFYRLGAMKL